MLKQYIDQQDTSTLNSAKAYTDAAIRGQDFSGFAKVSDVQALDKKLTGNLNTGLNNQKNYTDSKITQLTNDINANFEDVENSIDQLNDNMQEVFQSVSSGKAKIAEAITDKGVSTSATASFDTMANNIENIETGGGGVIPPGYVDTSDANAIPNDLLEGKTAYVNGQKIYGNLSYSGTHAPEYNPDNPYPSLAEVELVYGEKGNVLNVNNLGGAIGNYTIFDISSDKHILVAYDSTDNKIKTFIRNGNDYLQSFNQYGEQLTHEYTLSQLGITDDSNYEIAAIKMSAMNTSQTASGYECKIAILLRLKTNVTKDYELICYIFRISTKYGEIKYTNQTVQLGSNTYTEYNKWVIQISKGSTLPSTAWLSWSPFSSKLAMVWKRGTNKATCRIYDFLDTFLGTESNSVAVVLEDSFTCNISSPSTLRFYNMDRVVCYGNSYFYARVYDEHFTFIKESSISTVGIPSNDFLYGIKSGYLYAITTNYTTGEISITQLGTIDVAVVNAYMECFSRNNEYLIVVGSKGNTSTYKIDFTNMTATLVHTETDYQYEFTILSDLRSFIVKDSSNSYRILETVPDGEQLIGINYNGTMYYSSSYYVGRYSATPSDVRAGKTFIGYNGNAETGTADF